MVNIAETNIIGREVWQKRSARLDLITMQSTINQAAEELALTDSPATRSFTGHLLWLQQLWFEAVA